jgi:hypothetical protein
MAPKKNPEKRKASAGTKTTEEPEILEEPSPEEILMVNEYLANGGNKTRAYMKVHPNAEYDSARSTAPGIFAKPSIKALIKRILDEQAMPLNEALAIKAQHARGSLRPFLKFTSDGFPYFDFNTDEALANLHLIKKIKPKRERRWEGHGEDAEEWEAESIEVEIHDSAGAVTDILKMHGQFVEKVDLTSRGEQVGSYTPEEIAKKIMLIMDKAKKRKDATPNRG